MKKVKEQDIMYNRIVVNSAKRVEIKTKEDSEMDSEKKVEKKSVSPFLKFLASVGGRVVLTVVFAAILYSILLALGNTDNTVIFVIICIGCGYFGWQSLNKITPNLFIWMPIGKWVAFYLIKGFLSIVIGVLVAPFWLGKKISSEVMGFVDDALDNVGE